ncbi:MAG: cyclic pyranopterin monophosphate synthase MoaC [Tissierellia bacterium]|nr:cyclic pyranopterin monophosphate synthase MoaC [Tissierellia bacterium]
MNFTHFDTKGNAQMVDVSQKAKTARFAIAGGKIYLSKNCFDRIFDQKIQKGDVLTVAQIAGIMGMKKTGELIPLCHPLFLSGSSIEFVPHPEESSIEVMAKVKTNGKTGVEMEALTGVSITLLTIYDMVKSVDKSMVIGDIKLLEKSGGKSGDYVRNEGSA